MPKIHILGISSSPRNGNTVVLVEEALKGAAEVGNVRTNFMNLVGKTVNSCRGCVSICHPAVDFEAKQKKGIETERPWHLCLQKDYMHEIWDAMVEADGIIIGTPVYYGDVNSQLKAIMDRCTSLARIREDGTMEHVLRGKVGAAIAVGGCRNGGQESALATIIRFFMFCNMFPVGLPEIEDQELGVAAYGSNPQDVLKDEWVNYFNQKASSIKNVRVLGKKVALTINQINKK